LFQIFRELQILRYVNEKQLSMIRQKITQRNSELVNHREHFEVISVHP